MRTVTIPQATRAAASRYRVESLARHLLDGNTTRGRWWEQAACRRSAKYQFFPGNGEQAEIDQAREMCAGCPVHLDCGVDGLFIRDGVWGGLSYRERNTVKRALPPELLDVLRDRYPAPLSRRRSPNQIEQDGDDS